MAELSLDHGYRVLLQEVEELQETLSALIQERDELLFHTNPLIEADYMIKIGTLEAKAFEFQCIGLRLKRKTELVQAKLNRREPVLLPAIDEQLDLEYETYSEQLRHKMEQISRALQLAEGPFLSEEASKELKQLYHKITKKLHPDLNPDLTKEQSSLFLSAVSAYKNADLSLLRSISLLILEISPKALTFDSRGELIQKRDSLLRQIRVLKEHLGRIKESFPYSQKELLADESRIKERQELLLDGIEQYQAVHQQYEERLAQLLRRPL